jgi:hypothetical protein
MSAESSKQRDRRRAAPPRRSSGDIAKSGRPVAQPAVAAESEPDSGLRPSHLFLAATLVAAGAGAVAVRETAPTNVVFVCLVIGAAGLAAFTLYRAVWPLVGPSLGLAPDMVGGRTRAALEREKTVVLRAIKDLEFDRAMRKVSESDFQDMSGRLRARAVRLIKQLDSGSAGYRELIERELAARRMAADGRQRASGAATAVPTSPPPAPPESELVSLGSPACGRCGILNDVDAQFCKQCGNKLINSH